MIQRVLVVDDSQIARKILRSCMPKDAGYELDEAGNGEQGLKKFIEFKPNVTFLDITMPVMDGIHCLEEIKKADAEAIVIMCTADVQPKSIQKVTDLGAFTVLRKPPSKESVAKVLEKAEEALSKTRG